MTIYLISKVDRMNQELFLIMVDMEKKTVEETSPNVMGKAQVVPAKLLSLCLALSKYSHRNSVN
jgi:hypothetical protein